MIYFGHALISMDEKEDQIIQPSSLCSMNEIFKLDPYYRDPFLIEPNRAVFSGFACGPSLYA